MPIGIQESSNKFASLEVQGSSDENERDWSKVTKSTTNRKEEPKIEKKKRRRKKKNSTTFDDDPNELDGAEAQLRDWKARDQNFVENMYDGDLRRAIELSKVEHEREERDRSTINTTKVTVLHPSSETQHNSSENNSSSKKGRKKNKSRTLSLEEFQKRLENSLPLTSQSSNDDIQFTEPDKTDARSDPEPNFFAGVDEAVDKIKRNEAAKLRFQLEHYSLKDQQKGDLKDEVIKTLHTEVKDLEGKFKQVKKRNKQLLVMLQQGEMKEKSELLLEIERLSLLQSELTQEVTTLNQSLEQEKSRSRQYKDELLKLQGKNQ